jgi:membrane-associated protease RseP (regulator of RpoE activity)
LTCYTTYRAKNQGLAYALPVMGILLCHEFGHYLQARRYHVPASLPFFIPMPWGPLGTMGAVIAMRGHMGSRKALYDIGITGPLAGLVPAIICCLVGLRLSTLEDIPRVLNESLIGAPPLFQWLSDWIVGPIPPGKLLSLHPIAFAGWVGIFLTALNLIPIGQLDGGHVLYALLRGKAQTIAWLLLAGAFAGVILTRRYEWSLMLMLLLFIGPSHPPTANDEMPLGTGRIILGWLTLAFVLIGFTPRPFIM